MKYPFTVQQYFEVHKLTQARICLASKRISTVSSGDEETKDFSTLPVASSLSKTNPQGQNDRGRRSRQKYAAVENKEEKGVEIEDVQGLGTLRKMRESSVPPEPAESTERVKVLLKHFTEGNVSRFFSALEKAWPGCMRWIG